jgi:hypothetical protein
MPSFKAAWVTLILGIIAGKTMIKESSTVADSGLLFSSGTW